MEHSGKNVGEIGAKILNTLSLVPGKFCMNYLVMLELRQHFCSLLQASIQHEKSLIQERFHKFDGIMRLSLSYIRTLPRYSFVIWILCKIIKAGQ
jgi:hypothetical protein